MVSKKNLKKFLKDRITTKIEFNSLDLLDTSDFYYSLYTTKHFDEFFEYSKDEGYEDFQEFYEDMKTHLIFSFLEIEIRKFIKDNQGSSEDEYYYCSEVQGNIYSAVIHFNLIFDFGHILDDVVQNYIDNRSIEKATMKAIKLSRKNFKKFENSIVSL